MNKTEAYSILGLAPGVSNEEIKKAFKQKAVKLHPDVNTSDTAEQDFKELNEAYQFLTKQHDAADQFNWEHDRISKIMEDLFGKQSSRPSPINKIYSAISFTNISFQESVLGCSKTITYNIIAPCEYCNFKGVVEVATDKTCNRCNGTGRRCYEGSNEKELPCTTCKSSGKLFDKKTCQYCKGSRLYSTNTSVLARINPGIKNNTMIRLVANVHKGIQHHIDLRVSVEPEPGMELVGSDVISSLKISLLEALGGTSKEVNTIKGKKQLKIPGPRKHLDEIKAAGLGVPPSGAHIFILDVEYPEDLSKVIEALEHETRKVEDGI